VITTTGRGGKEKRKVRHLREGSFDRKEEEKKRRRGGATICRWYEGRGVDPVLWRRVKKRRKEAATVRDPNDYALLGKKNKPCFAAPASKKKKGEGGGKLIIRTPWKKETNLSS